LAYLRSQLRRCPRSSINTGFQYWIRQKQQKQKQKQKQQQQQKGVDHRRAMPRGYFIVYVGQADGEEEKIPIAVKASVLNHPLFADFLLEKAREEFGFDHEGPITIPCEIALFEHILHLIESGHSC
jgi:2-succinyl-5-enolpyruvyl-6-hydroxy-3-cyclohexene-1-carboxylate synthase